MSETNRGFFDNNLADTTGVSVSNDLNTGVRIHDGSGATSFQAIEQSLDMNVIREQTACYHTGGSNWIWSYTDGSELSRCSMCHRLVRATVGRGIILFATYQDLQEARTGGWVDAGQEDNRHFPFPPQEAQAVRGHVAQDNEMGVPNPYAEDIPEKTKRLDNWSPVETWGS